MNRAVAWVLAAAASLGVTAAYAKKKGYLEAKRAGWVLGMYVGADKGQIYPFVLQVDKNSDAARKGLRPGDELMRLEKREIRSLEWLMDEVQDQRPGSEVTLWVRRGALQLKFDVRVPKSSEPPQVEETPKEPKKAADAEEKTDEKKKKKKSPPVIIKPIPADEPN